MSYVIHIWEPTPLPTSAEEAEAQFDELPEDGMEQNPKFITVVQNLTARYPCITTLEADEGVWTDGPLDGVCDSGAYGLGIMTDYVDEVQPFVVAEANKLGLTVYDMQMGLFYLPSGQILGEA